jgi:hypothetical protein
MKSAGVWWPENSLPMDVGHEDFFDGIFMRRQCSIRSIRKVWTMGEYSILDKTNRNEYFWAADIVIMLITLINCNE